MTKTITLTDTGYITIDNLAFQDPREARKYLLGEAVYETIDPSLIVNVASTEERLVVVQDGIIAGEGGQFGNYGALLG